MQNLPLLSGPILINSDCSNSRLLPLALTEFIPTYVPQISVCINGKTQVVLWVCSVAPHGPYCTLDQGPTQTSCTVKSREAEKGGEGAS
jgi:hypothetical protein